MTDNRPPRIDLERAKGGPTAADLDAMPATAAADWADATVILPVDRDIFEHAAAKQRAHSPGGEGAGDRKKGHETQARKKGRR